MLALISESSIEATEIRKNRGLGDSLADFFFLLFPLIKKILHNHKLQFSDNRQSFDRLTLMKNQQIMQELSLTIAALNTRVERASDCPELKDDSIPEVVRPESKQQEGY